jgi:hypothetical protein
MRHAALAMVAAVLALATTPAAWADPEPNHNPTAMDFRWTVAQDTLLVVPAPGVLEAASDPDGDPLTPGFPESPQHGMLVNPLKDGSFAYRPEPGFVGVDRFHFFVADSRGGRSADHLVTILVGTAPLTAAPDHYVTDPDGTLTVAAPGVLGNDRDAVGHPLYVSLTSPARHGTVQLGSDGQFRYRARAGFSGTDIFDYTASNGSDRARASITITVAHHAPPPSHHPRTTAPVSRPTSGRSSGHPASHSPAPHADTGRRPALADTGTATAALTALGLLLITTGTLLTRRFTR